jgi:hypothetical protein
MVEREQQLEQALLVEVGMQLVRMDLQLFDFCFCFITNKKFK